MKNYKICIKKYRIANKWTQQEVADRMNITQQVYERIENNKVNPGVDKIVSLAKIFKIKLDDIIKYK